MIICYLLKFLVNSFWFMVNGRDKTDTKGVGCRV